MDNSRGRHLRIFCHFVADGLFEISTIELSDDPAYAGMKFKTLVFLRGDDRRELAGNRYSHLKDAEVGHHAMASLWEGAELITCVNCVGEGRGSLAIRMADESSFCAYNADHQDLCGSCLPEEPCDKHVLEEQAEV